MENKEREMQDGKEKEMPEGGERELTENGDPEPPLEELFSRLEETIGVLDRGDISLEESFRAYERGMKLVEQANAKIDRVEKQVLMLNQKGELDEFPGGV